MVGCSVAVGIGGSSCRVRCSYYTPRISRKSRGCVVGLLIVKRRVAFTQAAGCWGCVHVGEWAVYLWPTARRDRGWRLELFTEYRRFRWEHGAWLPAGRA